MDQSLMIGSRLKYWKVESGLDNVFGDQSELKRGNCIFIFSDFATIHLHLTYEPFLILCSVQL